MKEGIYVSNVILFKYRQDPYQDREIGDQYFLSVTHSADSCENADYKAKILFAKEIFKADVEFFGCHSVFVDNDIIDRITNSAKGKK